MEVLKKTRTNSYERVWLKFVENLNVKDVFNLLDFDEKSIRYEIVQERLTCDCSDCACACR